MTALWRKLTDQSVECDDGPISGLIYWLCAGILTSRHSMVSGVHERYLYVVVVPTSIFIVDVLQLRSAIIVGRYRRPRRELMRLQLHRLRR